MTYNPSSLFFGNQEEEFRAGLANHSVYEKNRPGKTTSSHLQMLKLSERG